MPPNHHLSTSPPDFVSKEDQSVKPAFLPLQLAEPLSKQLAEPLSKQERSDLLFKVIDLNTSSVIPDLERGVAPKLKDALAHSVHFYKDKELWEQFCNMRVWSRRVKRPSIADQDRALFHLIRWVMRSMWSKEKCLECYSLLLDANLGQNPTIAQVEEVIRGRGLFRR